MYDSNNLNKLGKLGASATSQWQTFKAFDQAVMADGAISKKHKELIAVAVALATS